MDALGSVLCIHGGSCRLQRSSAAQLAEAQKNLRVSLRENRDQAAGGQKSV